MIAVPDALYQEGMCNHNISNSFIARNSMPKKHHMRFPNVRKPAAIAPFNDSNNSFFCHRRHDGIQINMCEMYRDIVRES